MNFSQIAKLISDISEREKRIIFYSPAELEKALNEGRAVVLKNQNRLIGFGFWDAYGPYAEVHTLYVNPDFRGQGHLRQITETLKQQILNKSGQISHVFLFTRSPAVEHVVLSYDFEKIPYWRLPPLVFFKLAWSRLKPHRLLSYFKYTEYRLFFSDLFIKKLST